jgi:predicted amidohydrolase YtcJ
MEIRLTMKLRTTVFLLSLVLLGSSAHGQAIKSRIFINGVIYTVNDKNEVAQAVEITGGKISAVGSTEKLLLNSNPGAQIIDLKGRTVVPGLIDAHGHLLGLGRSLTMPDLVGTDSFAQVLDVIATYTESAAPGEWIVGRGWDQNDWPDTAFPIHNELSKRTPHNPVYLARVGGHAALANAEAMRVSGVDRDTPDPPGGKIIRDAAGEPTGVFIDAAVELISRNIPPLSKNQIAKSIRAAIDECSRFGLTGVHDAGITPYIEDIYKEMIDGGDFKLRVYAMLRAAGENPVEALLPRLQQGPLIGYGKGRLTVRSIKMVADGALGSRGAALFADYSDDPGNRGILIAGYEELKAVSLAALRHDFQMCVHCIGDKANHITLDAYDDALKEVPSRNHRFRIEHAQVVAMEDIPRFDRMNIIASMQSTHATSDMPWVEARLGPDRILGAYAWRRFIDIGVTLANGSDFPVESPNPMLGFYAAVTRQDAQGRPEGGWYPDQRMTRDEALRSFTINAAYAAFQDDTRGSLEVGKWGDLVVLSKNIMTIPPLEIPDAQVLMTVLGGKVVYRR